MSRRPVGRLLLGSAFAALAALAWLGYQRPDFVLWLGSSLLVCT
jgi:hypothetical protein